MTVERRILIADDDETLLDVLNEQLQLHEEFQTITARTAGECLELATTNHFDAILLGSSLPDMDGSRTCRLIRQNSVKPFILMLIEPNTDPDMTLGLEVGAIDFIAKPFRLGLLLSKLRAHIRQHDFSIDATLTIGPYKFQPLNKLLVRETDQIRLRLTDKETAILKHLYRAGNKVVSREVLLDEVWGYNANVTTHTLETHVYRLRQKIEPDPYDVTILITEPGGYRLKQ